MGYEKDNAYEAVYVESGRRKCKRDMKSCTASEQRIQLHVDQKTIDLFMRILE